MLVQKCFYVLETSTRQVLSVYRIFIISFKGKKLNPLKPFHLVEVCCIAIIIVKSKQKMV